MPFFDVPTHQESKVWVFEDDSTLAMRRNRGQKWKRRHKSTSIPLPPLFPLHPKAKDVTFQKAVGDRPRNSEHRVSDEDET
ncbi:hypothetical protein TNCV_4903781 [Trichonephila clavipes]|nr:hypothetical protein TNCV_4903781 [Trichonephila clavipes]